MKNAILVIMFFIVGICAALPAYAVDTASKKILDIQSFKSPGGIEIWLTPDSSVPVLALAFAFKGAGSAHDPADKQGLARLASNTMDEGAGDIDSRAFQKELNDLSIDLRFNAGRDDFGGTLKTLTKNKKRAAELLALAVGSPRFDAEAVDRMRAANQSRIREALSDPEWIAARLLNDRSFAGHPYAQNSGGTLSGLAAITPEDLKNFHKTMLGKNNLVVTAAGDITPKDLGVMVDQIFGNLPVVSVPPVAPATLQNTGKIFHFKKDIPQTVIEIMQPGIDIKDPDYPAAQVMNFILGSSGFGSRLTEEIREKNGLTYGIYSSFLDMDHFDGLGVSTSTENKNAARMMEMIKAEWKKMKETPISDEELTNSKNYLVGALPLALTSTDAIAGYMLSLRTSDLPPDHPQNRIAEIRALTAADIDRAAKRILDESAFVTIMVGAPQNVPGLTLIEKLPNAE